MLGQNPSGFLPKKATKMTRSRPGPGVRGLAEGLIIPSGMESASGSVSEGILWVPGGPENLPSKSRISTFEVDLQFDPQTPKNLSQPLRFAEIS